MSFWDSPPKKMRAGTQEHRLVSLSFSTFTTMVSTAKKADVWDSKTQTFHGGQEHRFLDNFIEDFSVTTNYMGTPVKALEAAKEAVSIIKESLVELLTMRSIDGRHSPLSCCQSRTSQDQPCSIPLAKRLCRAPSAFAHGQWCLRVDRFGGTQDTSRTSSTRCEQAYMEGWSMECTGKLVMDTTLLSSG